MLVRFRELYGSGPLHLLALIASLLITAAAVTRWFDNNLSTTVRVLVWFTGAIIAHDLILLPLYSVLDRIAFGARHEHRGPPAHGRAHGLVYLRVPALLSGLLFVVFFPEILRLGNQTFAIASGLHQNVYLTRYLLTCGVQFALSGLMYAVSLGRARSRAHASARNA